MPRAKQRPRVQRICQNPKCQKVFMALASRVAKGHSKYCCIPCVLYRTPEERFWSFVNKTETCWLWTGGGAKGGKGNGYGLFRFKDPDTGAQRDIGAHCYSWMLVHGPIPDGLFICHSCDIRACVNPAHLWPGTQGQNMQDCIQKGRFTAHGAPKGSANHSAKLHEEDIPEIRELLKTTSCYRVARIWNMSECAISSIRDRITWADIP